MTHLVDPLLTPGVARPGTSAPAAAAPGTARADTAFGDVLARQAGDVRFSGHALQRIARRGIGVGPRTIARLQQAIARAAGKGARDSVVLVDGVAFVVSVSNKTVVTAVDPAHMRDHVFTNIDSAVIA